jgi:hypothetical protein
MISKKSIEAKYRRSGVLPKKTWLWADMPENEKSEVQRYIQLQLNECIIICYFQPPEYVLFLTTQGVIIVNGDKTERYSYESMKDVKLEEIFTARKTKQESDVINILFKSSEVIDIIVEVGTWHVLYSILKLIIISQEGNVSE